MLARVFKRFERRSWKFQDRQQSKIKDNHSKSLVDYTHIIGSTTGRASRLSLSDQPKLSPHLIATCKHRENQKRELLPSNHLPLQPPPPPLNPQPLLNLNTSGVVVAATRATSILLHLRGNILRPLRLLDTEISSRVRPRRRIESGRRRGNLRCWRIRITTLLARVRTILHPRRRVRNEVLPRLLPPPKLRFKRS